MKIIVDYRERRSKVIESLEKLGADIEITTLKVGNYIVSDRVAFERKRIDDLLLRCLNDVSYSHNFTTLQDHTNARS